MYFKLKDGITLIDHGNSHITLDAGSRCVDIPGTHQGISTRVILHYLDGTRTPDVIAQSLEIDPNILETLLLALDREGFIDREITKIPYSQRYNPKSGRNEGVDDVEKFAQDPAIKKFLARFLIEARGVTLFAGVRDGGRRCVIDRREFSILIFGTNRIALTLFGILSASGFSTLGVINRSPSHHPSHHVEPNDLTGAFLGNSHLTRSKSELVEDLRRESSLFPESHNPSDQVDLIIAFAPPPPESLQRWHSDETPYLLIDSRSGHHVAIGPFVIPGKTPCFRCIYLNYEGKDRLRFDKSNESEPPAALVAHVAGIIASDVISYAHNGSSVFFARTSQYSLNLDEIQRAKEWSFHPECGCQWR